MVTEARANAIIIIDRDDRAEAMRIAAENGVEVQELTAEGFEPILTITLLILGTAAAVALVSDLIDKAKGGQVIDLRVGAPKPIYRTKDVIYGTVVIFAADGKVEIEVKEIRGAFGIVIDALKGIAVDLGKASLDAIAEAAKKAVGDKGTVTTKANPVPVANPA